MAGMLWSKFFWTDWISDIGLRRCSPADRGIWMDMLCIAAQHNPPGYVAIGGDGFAADDVARLCGTSVALAKKSLENLEKNGVFSRNSDGIIYSRRMVNDAKRLDDSRVAGSLGGNKKLKDEYNIEGYIYFALRSSDQRIKIGASTEPRKRMYKLRRQYPNDVIELIGSIRVPNMGSIEADVHQRWASRAFGEWFEITPTDVRNEISRLQGDTIGDKVGDTTSRPTVSIEATPTRHPSVTLPVPTPLRARVLEARSQKLEASKPEKQEPKRPGLSDEIGSGARDAKGPAALSAEDEAWQQFRSDIAARFEDNGRPMPETGYVEVWRNHGFNLQVCRAIVLGKQKMPRGLKYFDEAIAEAHTKPVAEQPRSQPTPPASAPDPETVDWERCISFYAKTKVWIEPARTISPAEPGSPNCRAPMEIQKKYGFGPHEEARAHGITWAEWGRHVEHFRKTEDEWTGPGPNPIEVGCRAPISILHASGYRRMIFVDGQGTIPDPADPLPSSEPQSEPLVHVNGSAHSEHPEERKAHQQPPEAQETTIQEETT